MLFLCLRVRIYICGSIDIIDVHIGAGVQKIRSNMLHHLTEKGQKMNGFLALNFRVATLTHLRDQRRKEKSNIAQR